MDCREFRKRHFAYLDDTLPGDSMTAAQQHIMTCDGCAAHDTMVRRSLMLVRNLSAIEPSAEFRQRMRARLAEARADHQREQFQAAEAATRVSSRGMIRQPMVLTVVAAGALVMGTAVWREVAPRNDTVISMQPVAATLTVAEPPIDTTQQVIYLSPGMVQAMATGNPVWPAALLVDDAPAQMVNSEFSQVRSTR